MPARPTTHLTSRYRLSYRVPYDFAALLAFFGKRAIAGIETVDEKSYQRNFAFDGKAGRVRVTQAKGDALNLTTHFADKSRHADIAARIRRMFDIDADVVAINRHFSKDARLRHIVKRTPGLRLPGGWDVFEIALRAVLGQQVSVAAARTLGRRLVERFGEAVTSLDGENVKLFPTPASIADADLTSIGLPRTRAATLNNIARAVRDGVVSTDRDQPLDEFVASWTQLRGIGDWTAHYIAMRALSHRDAFPAADLVLRKAVGRNGELAPLRELHEIARGWQPWRAYAVLHLWRSLGE